MARSRNKELVPGVNRLGRHRSSAKNHIHWKKGKDNKSKQTLKPTKAVAKRESRWYQADSLPKPIPSRKSHHRATRLRGSITPGTVLIVLAGRFRGKRVVFLKQLASGLLLVSGPYKVNGVPLRRFNQRYVIATSTKVDVSKADVSKIDDTLFAKVNTPKQKKEGETFFEEKKNGKDKVVVSQARKTAQAAVDKALIASVKAVPNLRQYLNAKFTLTNDQKPHELKF